MERETQRVINYFVFKGRKLKAPNDVLLTAARCVLANIPRKCWSSVWRYYPSECPAKNILMDYVDNLDQHRKDGKGLFIFGRTRRGKTSAATLIAKEVIRRDGFPLFVPCAHIPRIECSADSEDVELSQKMRHITFLILDDLGADSGRDKAAAMIEQVIRDRDNQMLPTIVTTNLDETKLEKEFGLPMLELLLETCIAVPFK